MIADVISVVKEGQLNYRDSIRSSDASGIVIQMIPNAGDVTDADGNVYQSVKIGTLVWTTENLRTTKLRDGTVIPLITARDAWLGTSAPAYCFYDNSVNPAEHRKWGALYNWYAVNTGKLAPAGWHVPSEAEWDPLAATLSGNYAKSMSAKTDWKTSTSPGTPGNDMGTNNASGFAAIPAGSRCDYPGMEGVFDYRYRRCHFWTSTEFSASMGWDRHANFDNTIVGRFNFDKRSGESVRLVRD